MYHNCKLIAPDDQLLSTIDVKKALWYVDKGLGGKFLLCEQVLRKNSQIYDVITLTVIKTDVIGFYGIVWRCSYCTETDNNTEEFKVLFAPSVYICFFGVTSDSLTLNCTVFHSFPIRDIAVKINPSDETFHVKFKLFDTILISFENISLLATKDSCVVLPYRFYLQTVYMFISKRLFNIVSGEKENFLFYPGQTKT